MLRRMHKRLTVVLNRVRKKYIQGGVRNLDIVTVNTRDKLISTPARSKKLLSFTCGILKHNISTYNHFRVDFESVTPIRNPYLTKIINIKCSTCGD